MPVSSCKSPCELEAERHVMSRHVTSRQGLVEQLPEECALYRCCICVKGLVGHPAGSYLSSRFLCNYMISYARYNSSQNWYRTQGRLLLTVSTKLLLSGRFLAVLSLVCSHSLFSGKLLPTELALKLPGRPTCASLHVNLKQKLQETVTMIMQETFSLAPLVSCSPQNSQSWDTGTYTNMIRFGHYRIELQCTVIHRPCC